MFTGQHNLTSPLCCWPSVFKFFGATLMTDLQHIQSLLVLVVLLIIHMVENFYCFLLRNKATPHQPIISSAMKKSSLSCQLVGGEFMGPCWTISGSARSQNVLSGLVGQCVADLNDFVGPDDLLTLIEHLLFYNEKNWLIGGLNNVSCGQQHDSVDSFHLIQLVS